MARDASNRADLVLAAGGDGTVHEVAEGLLGGQAALGIIPAGSGNGLARELGIPTDWTRAIADLPLGSPRSIDVGMVNGRPFFATASIGFDAEVARRYGLYGDRFRGLGPYVWHALSAWLQYRPSPITLTIDGRSLDENPLILVVANTGQYGFGVRIAPGASPYDGKLHIVRLDRPTTFGTLAVLSRLIRGTIRKSSKYRSDAATSLIVNRGAPGLIQIDGEPIDAEAQLRFSVQPGALRVWLPSSKG